MRISRETRFNVYDSGYDDVLYNIIGVYGGNKVVIPNTITKIADYKLKNTNIHNLELPESLVSIGKYSISSTWLHHIDFSKCVNLISIDEYGLYNSQQLEEIDLSNTKIKTIPIYCFKGSSHLTDVKLPNSIEEIKSNAFSECFYISSINLNDCVNLTSIGDYAFYWIDKDLTLIELDKTKVKTLGNYCFQRCSLLQTITLPETLTSLGDYCFNSCSALTSINLNNCNNLTSLGQRCFNSCTSLTEMTIPSSVTSIGTNCFKYCSNLTTITINKSQDSISGAPWGAPNATVVWNG